MNIEIKNPKGFLRELVGKDSYIRYNKFVARNIGIYESILLGELVSKENYYDNKGKLIDGEWFFYDKKKIEENTGLSNNQLWKTVKILKALKLIDVERRGSPPRNYFKIEHLNYVLFLTDIEKYKETVVKDLDFKSLETKSLKIKKLNIFINNKKNNTKKEILSKDNISVSKETHKRPKFKISDDIGKIIKEILLLGDFNNILDDDLNNVSKTIFNISNFILSMKEGKLSRHYSINQDWIKKNNIIIPNGKDSSDNIILKNLKIAIRRFNKMKVEGFYPNDKTKLPKSLLQFLYNPYKKNSWFLYCLNNLPKEIAQTQDTKVIETIPENIKEISLSYKPNDWDETEYLIRIAKLYKWYNKNDTGLGHLNRISHGWYSYCNCFSSFLELIFKFADTWKGGWTVKHFGLNNTKVWKLFEKWLYKEYDTDIDYSDEAIKNAEKGYIEELEERKKRESYNYY